ncbi:MAG: hypothetical protein KDD44_11965, partial [Bdellovibrionales bacterium]|nr:hypothetical protein [Bdellovibrionales bacterium]
VLLYIPNRIFDLIDIFRIDVGLGISAGATLRLTSYGQAGYRVIDPWSLRCGLQGRDWPIFVERGKEHGFGPDFIRTSGRTSTPYEVGAGVDLGVAGAYAGISIDELADFMGGIFLLDFKNDDY